MPANTAAAAPPPMGHNAPPDPLDEALAPFGDTISEAEGWLDGQPVETEGQMKAVDTLLKGIKAAKKAAETAEESEAKPYYDQWKAAKARFKPTLDDLNRIAKGLVAIVDAFKRKLAAEKAEAERKAWAEAYAARQAAERAAQEAAAGDIEAMRAAAAARAEAEAAQRAANAASKDTVKGLHKVTRYEITDERAALHWIARTDRPAVADFIQEYVRKHHRDFAIDGVRVWTEREAF